MAQALFNENYCCPLCNRFHAIRQCSRFIVMPVEQKLRVVSQYSLCYNCLAQSHTLPDCKCIDRCRRCMQQHHSWLHPMPEGRVWVQMTAHIRVTTGPGKKVLWTRALIDPTAARSAITLRTAENMGCNISRGRTKLSVFHKYEPGRSIEIELVVEDRIYGRSPSSSVESEFRDSCTDPSANRYWHRSLEYHVIFGADAAGRILLGPAKGKPGSIYIQETIFGLAYFGEGIRVRTETTERCTCILCRPNRR